MHFTNLSTGWALKRRDVEHAENQALEMLQAPGSFLTEDQNKESFFIIAGDAKMAIGGRLILFL